MRARFSDRGSATVWSVGAIGVLCVVFGAVLVLGQVVLARHRAAGSADLAALAAADHWTEGAEAACARAERVARATGTRLVRCVVTGEISDVTATAALGPFTARARARAGPAGAAPATRRPRAHGQSAPAGTAPAPPVRAPRGPDRTAASMAPTAADPLPTAAAAAPGHPSRRPPGRAP